MRSCVAIAFGQYRVHGIHNFRAPSIIERHAEFHALVPCGLLHRLARVFLHGSGKFIQPAKKAHANFVLLKERHLLAQIFTQERHEEVDFRFGPPPIFH